MNNSAPAHGLSFFFSSRTPSLHLSVAVRGPGMGEGEGDEKNPHLIPIGYFLVHPAWNQRRFIPTLVESGAAHE